MENKLVVTSSILISAPPGQVWDALVNPEKTKIYMFGCATVSDWETGSDLLWKGDYEGTETVFVKGKILQIEPNRLLKYTVIDPFAAYPDIPENYLNVTCRLQEFGIQTELIVIQDGFDTAADGEKRYTDSYNNSEGWNPILVQIKHIAEST